MFGHNIVSPANLFEGEKKCVLFHLLEAFIPQKSKDVDIYAVLACFLMNLP